MRLEAPKEGDWGVVLKEEYFDRIKSAGFDSVRLPVRWSAHAEASPPYRIDRKFFDRVDWAIDQLLRRRITPIVNMHNYDELVQQPDKHRERFVALWRQIAEHYQGYPRALAFELFNEPNANLTADKWNRLLAETIEVVRRTNPTREIVVGPIGWNGIKDSTVWNCRKGSPSDGHGPLLQPVPLYPPRSKLGRARFATMARHEVDRHAGRSSGTSSAISTRRSPGRSSIAGRSGSASSARTARPTSTRAPAGPASSPKRP